MLFAGNADLTLSVWNLSKSEQRWVLSQTLTGHTHFVMCTFYENGTLFSGARDGIKIWNLNKADGKWAYSQTLTHTSSVNTLFYANGLLFSGYYDGPIKVWKNNPDTQSFELSATLDGHSRTPSGVKKLFYANDFLFSVGWELKIWKFKNELARWECRQTLEEGVDSDEALFYTNGLLYVGTERMNAIKVWELNSDTQQWGCIESYRIGKRYDPVRYLYYSNGVLFFGFQKVKVLKSNKLGNQNGPIL